MIIDEEKNEVEIYAIEKSKYVLQKILAEIPFTFFLEDNCKISYSLRISGNNFNFLLKQ